MATLPIVMNTNVESPDKLTELLWQDALRHLHSTNNEVLLPINTTDMIGQSNVNKIKDRLCALIGAPVVAFVDETINAFRVMRTPVFSGTAVSVASHEVALNVHNEATVAPANHHGNHAVARNAKVPRPPNAFILYRQQHHPRIKATYPDFHNNDISVMLGKQWKAESDAVKAHFKALADEIKRKHAEEHPDYQYAPRKPSEKKRRASSRQYPKHQVADALLESASPMTAASTASTPAVQSVMGDANVAINDNIEGDFAFNNNMVVMGDAVFDETFNYGDVAFNNLVQQASFDQSQIYYPDFNNVVDQNAAQAFDFNDFVNTEYY